MMDALGSSGLVPQGDLASKSIIIRPKSLPEEPYGCLSSQFTCWTASVGRRAEVEEFPAVAQQGGKARRGHEE